MIRIATAAVIAAATLTAPALAADKKTSCAHQAAVVAAVQAARLDGVKETKVAAHITASDRAWPANYDAAIPIIAPWVYEQKRRDLRTKDLSAAWSELCLSQ